MELVAAVSPDLDQTGAFENGKMLGDRLPRRAEPMVRYQTATNLEERLTIALREFVQNRPPCGVRQGSEYILVQEASIGK